MSQRGVRMNEESGEQVVLVTGCSSGIGRQIAIRLASHQVRVLATVRSEADAASLAAESPRIEPVILDVTDHTSIGRLAAEVGRRFPEGIDGLINNAGIVVAGPLELVDLDSWRRQFEVNVFGLVTLTQAFLPSLRRRRGRVINIGSSSSSLALPLMGPYASSKAAVDLLSDALRRELRPCGIAVITIRPGQTATAIYSKSEQEAVSRLERAEAPRDYDYLPRLERFQQLIQQSARFRAAPERVADKAVSAYFARRPRAHYHVGWDAKLSRLVSLLMPTRLVDWVIDRRLRPD